MDLLKKLVALLLLYVVSVSFVDARGGHGGGHRGGHGGGRHHSGGHHYHGGRHGYHGRHGGYYGGYGYGGAVAGGVIAGAALGAAASSTYNNYDDEYTSYPVSYNNQTYVTQQPVDDAMDIE